MEALAPTQSGQRPPADDSSGTNMELVDLHDMPATSHYPTSTRQPTYLFGRLHFPLNTGHILPSEGDCVTVND